MRQLPFQQTRCFSPSSRDLPIPEFVCKTSFLRKSKLFAYFQPKIGILYWPCELACRLPFLMSWVLVMRTFV